MNTVAVFLLIAVYGTPWTLSEDLPVAPRITLDQHTGVYVKGEAATLTCTSLGKYNGSPFTFYKSSKLMNRKLETRKLNRLRIDHISNEDRGFYSCQVSRSASGRMRQSQPSNTVEIIVIDQLTTPVVSVNQPTRVYLEGGEVILSCMVKGNYFGKTYIFYRNSRMLYSDQIIVKHHTGTFRVTTVNQDEKYQCQYGTSINGRWLWSQLSEAVSITVAAYPLQPSVSLSRQDEVFVKGEVIAITCKVRSPYLGSTFYLYRANKNKPVKIKAAKASQSSVTFDISNQLEAGMDTYSCAYRKNMSEREINSERSESVTITVVDPLRTPRISVDQESGVYLEGEIVTIACSSSRQYYRQIIFFYRDRQLLPSQQFSLKGNTATFRVSGISQRGMYQCKYGTTVKTRWLESQLSEPVTVTIADPLTTPGISLNQLSGVYLEGEMVTITCTVNREYNGQTYYFYKDSQQLTSHQIFVRKNTGIFAITTMNQAGRYHCKYGISLKTRWIESQPSDTIAITIADPLTQPQVSLDQSSGVYLEGESVTITCIGSREHRDNIYFYRNNQLLSFPQIPANNNTRTFIATSPNQGGQYQCRYETLVKTRQLLSQLSDAVTIFIADLSKPILSVDSRLLGKYGKATFNCTGPWKLAAVTFSLYEHGEENYSSVQSVSAQNNSVTFTVTNINRFNTRSYTCQYNSNTRGRMLMSAQSDVVHFNFKDNSSGLGAGMGCAVVLFLIFALIGLYFWKKGKSRRSREISKVPDPWKNELLSFAYKNRRGVTTVSEVPVPASLQF